MKTKQLKLLLGIMLYLTGFSYDAIADPQTPELQLPKSSSMEQCQKYIGDELFLPDFPMSTSYENTFMFTVPKKEVIHDRQGFSKGETRIVDGYKTWKAIDYGYFVERIHKEDIINKTYKLVDIIPLPEAKELHMDQINKLMRDSKSVLRKLAGYIDTEKYEVNSFFNMAAEESTQGLCFVLTDEEGELVYTFDIGKFVLNSAWEQLKKDYVGKSFIRAEVVNGPEHGAYTAVSQSEYTCTDISFSRGDVCLMLGDKGSDDGRYLVELSKLCTELPSISDARFFSEYMGEELFNDFSKVLSAQNDSLRIEREKREVERARLEAEQRAEQQRIQEEREREYLLSRQAKFAGYKSVEKYLDNETERKNRIFKKYGTETGLQIFNNTPVKGMKKSMLPDMIMYIRSVDKKGDEEIITAEFFDCVRKIHMENGLITKVEAIQK